MLKSRFFDMNITLSSNIPLLPLTTMQCWGLLKANEQKWVIQHCTEGVGALCKQPYAKWPNSFDDADDLKMTTLLDDRWKH